MHWDRTATLFGPEIASPSLAGSFTPVDGTDPDAFLFDDILTRDRATEMIDTIIARMFNDSRTALRGRVARHGCDELLQEVYETLVAAHGTNSIQEHWGGNLYTLALAIRDRVQTARSPPALLKIPPTSQEMVTATSEDHVRCDA